MDPCSVTDILHDDTTQADFCLSLNNHLVVNIQKYSLLMQLVNVKQYVVK